MIQQESFIFKAISPIAKLLGFLYNLIFNAAYAISDVNSLGIAIIIITILIRILLWPLSFKQFKSSMVISTLQPEIKKIQNKYSKIAKDDVESRQKMNIELQKLYQEHNANPASGCLIAFIQLPIFIALNQLLIKSYVYVDKLRVIYENIAEKIMALPNYVALVRPLAVPKVPDKMQIDLSVMSDFLKVIDKFTTKDWETLFTQIPSDLANQISSLLIQKHNMESFFGISLTDVCGLEFPGILIPIITVAVTFLSSYVMQKIMPVVSENAKSQNIMTLIFTPLLMGAVSFSFLSGVGIYCIVTSLTQIVIQIFAKKYFDKKQQEVKK